jgi:hypothetical protein
MRFGIMPVLTVCSGRDQRAESAPLVDDLALVWRVRSFFSGIEGGGSGFQPAIVRAQASASELSVIPGNRRRNSIAADSSPSFSKMAWIAAASDSETTNMAGSMGTHAAASKPSRSLAGITGQLIPSQPCWMVRLLAWFAAVPGRDAARPPPLLPTQEHALHAADGMRKDLTANERDAFLR